MEKKIKDLENSKKSFFMSQASKLKVNQEVDTYREEMMKEL